MDKKFYDIELIKLDEFIFLGEKVNGIDSLLNKMTIEGKDEYIIISNHSRASSDAYFDKLKEYFNMYSGKAEGLDYTYNYRIISIKN